jgi:hypothetical protein
MLKVDQNLRSEGAEQKHAGPPAGAPPNFYVRVLRHQRPTVIVFMVLIMAIAFFT